tara:strand:- start:2687 stop:3130 length:444 start_codon:yes stop_codon:yes gene_type:complete
MKAAVLRSLCLTLTLFTSCATAPRDLVGTSSTPVFYNLQLTIKEGQQTAFAKLMAEMVAATKQEAGTMVYEWYLGSDGRTCHIHELFADTAAYKVHSANFGEKFAARFLPLLDITGLTAYGNSDQEAREMMASLNPVFFEAIGGFRR